MDDEDAFLYGDLDAEPPVDKGDSMDDGADNLDVDVYEGILDAPGNGQLDNTVGDGGGGGGDSHSGDEISGEDSSSDDDEDLEVILEPGAANANIQSNNADGANGEGGDAGSGGAAAGTADANKAKGAETGMQALFSGDVDMIDLLTVQLLNGIDMFKIDLDMLEEKPWRLPGADVTDYFNFGFNEETWKLYCLKQKQLRMEFNARKMLPPAMMMMPGAGGMPMANPAMFQAMMNQGFRPEMAGNMYPPGMVPPFMRPGQGQPGISPMGGQMGGKQLDADDDDQDGGEISEGDEGDATAQSGRDGASQRMANMPPNSQAMQQGHMHLTPQQIQFQQQQMRMGMMPGYYPGSNFAQGMGGPQRNMPMTQQQMNSLPPQMQMQLQMQMGGRPPMAPNSQGTHSRPGPNAGPGSGSNAGPASSSAMGANAMQRGPSTHRPPSSLSQAPDQRDSDRGTESGRTSRLHENHEKAESHHRHRERDDTRESSRTRHGREREKDRAREKERGLGDHDKSVADARRSGHRQGSSRESSSRNVASRESSGRDKDGHDRSSRTHENSSGRGGDRPDRHAHKRRRSSSRDKDIKGGSKRRH
ncbi:cleavage polyadenylation factor subunit fip1 [Coemansia aciculifera]|uniref:Cleavage polyadenylation factor subunit fip1 n=1 Tax=Coemansia aciculifera TaxID=417176 RepID=A0A9W8IT35_9FUNG|nr:cleavage polyadenylation factor subunit fip1 [Coemansia aciculifera]